MAPEVLFNFAGQSYDVKSDCWSLGVLLYQLLCGNLLVMDDLDEETFSITASNGKWKVDRDLLQCQGPCQEAGQGQPSDVTDR